VTVGVRARALLAAAGLSVALGTAGASRAETLLLVAAGLGGEESYSEAFLAAALELEDAALAAGVPRERVWLLAEDPERDPERVRAKSTQENLLAALREMASTSEEGDDLWLVLIGHGSLRDGQSSVNLPGPDLTDAELAAALTGLAGRRLVVVNAASASGGFVGTLSGPQRVIVTATKSAAQRNETQFATHFVDGLAGSDADADRDGHVSVLEAFHYAQREVERHYESAQLLRTEHALLDDDGDGEGSLDPQLLGGEGASKDGLLAAQIWLGSGAGEEVPAGMEELARERAQLQTRLDDLRRRKGSLSEEAYQQELEQLLLEIARIDQRLREARGPGAAKDSGESRDDPERER
jgi:hypothetical protein